MIQMASALMGKSARLITRSQKNDTTESSQNSYPDVLDDYYSELEALTEAADDEKTKEEMARLATECAGLYSIEECDTEAGTLFQLSVFITGQ